MNSASLNRLLCPQTVAVIGASEDASRIGGKPIAYMLKQGFAGTILPVNPKRETVQGLKAYPSIDALPETPDVAIVAVPASAVLDTVTALAKRGCAGAILFSAGFAEIGEKGAALQDEIVAMAKAHGMRLIGPNSLGMINPQTHFYGSFATGLELGFPKPGNVAIVSQSGAYGAHLMTAAVAAGIGLSAMVMTGNEADLTLGDIVDLLVEDPNTKVIALYSEGVKEADTLVAALERARQKRKPVVIMKVGQSALGQAAALSHTASIAGDDRVFDAVMAELGVVRVQTTEQMLDIARLATRGIYPADNTLGVFTVSGGAGVIISDAAALHQLAMPPMPESAQKKLLELLPFATPVNPVDTTAQVLNDMTLMRAFTESLVVDGGYRSILGFVTYTATAATTGDRLREELKSLGQAHPDRLFVLIALGDADKLRRYEEDGFTVFEDPSRAVAAIAAMGHYGQAFDRQPKQTPPAMAAITLPDTTPSEATAKAILSAAGISVVPETVCTTPEQAIAASQALNGPAVLKIVSPDILHKTEMGGVLLNVQGDDQIRAGFQTLIERAKQHDSAARIEGVLVAKQMQGGVQCLLGIQRDPVFGPMAVFGLGGIFVEILDDVVLHRCPFGEDVALEMIHSIKGAPLLLGARGQAKADLKALAKMLAKLSAFAVAAGPKLQSIDLNPVFVMPEGEGVYAADAVITLQP
ncbi:acetate--CoA ligase family protein [Orrella daihaiensis]|uniref:Acetate--CoA ligase family protein n=1 Tax=Orrella daihaiensis TaxID=2782176 RepID=A0ABY4AJJ7_9BURK|nr:acetate--CoA ligase family protein [Orrella daihaiensis]UOD50457.1 acetate--CoA ligase family protein [Orrella daihaiensis]